MIKSLNPDQAKGLANFFFDTARGIALAVFGISAAVPAIPINLRLANIAGGLILTYVCVKFALKLLEK